MLEAGLWVVMLRCEGLQRSQAVVTSSQDTSHPIILPPHCGLEPCRRCGSLLAQEAGLLSHPRVSRSELPFEGFRAAKPDNPDVVSCVFQSADTSNEFPSRADREMWLNVGRTSLAGLPACALLLAGGCEGHVAFALPAPGSVPLLGAAPALLDRSGSA